jgi:hypothetical protein
MATILFRWTAFAAIFAALEVSGEIPKASAVTTFLHHLDAPDPVTGGAGTASYAAGSPMEQAELPSGSGGTTVPGGKFGNALDRSTGGRVEYQTAGNYNVNKGTVEMWIRGPGIMGSGFNGLWGTDTDSGDGDIRMYIYDTEAGRTLGVYQLGAGGTFWECKQAIPPDRLDDSTWHHVAWAFDTAAGKTAIWWDGQLLRNTPDSGTVNPRTSFTGALFHIGENQAGSATWPGLIDEFRISDNIVYNMDSNFNPPTTPFPLVPEPGTLERLVARLLVWILPAIAIVLGLWGANRFLEAWRRSKRAHETGKPS